MWSQPTCSSSTHQWCHRRRRWSWRRMWKLFLGTSDNAAWVVPGAKQSQPQVAGLHLSDLKKATRKGKTYSYKVSTRTKYNGRVGKFSRQIFIKMGVEGSIGQSAGKGRQPGLGCKHLVVRSKWSACQDLARSWKIYLLTFFFSPPTPPGVTFLFGLVGSKWSACQD